ncbi:MAG: hypothetical protein KKG92_11650 [Gammaproteobacteria bacterium]|nr:hypothetical protein [Gammaproteobacteria bacterium]
MNTLLSTIIQAGQVKGLNQADIARLAGIHPGSLSRALSSGRCQLVTAEALARAVGLRIVCVADNDLAEQLIKGSVF